jgi:transposase
VLANPKQVRALHGRKSDKRDSQRIAEFLQDRRIDPSLVPPPEIRRLREWLRHRVNLLEQHNQIHNQIRDLFETANLKLSRVASDLLGVTGQRIVEALIAGETSPDRLSGKVKGSLRKKEREVRQSLVGCFDEHHRYLLDLLWKQYQFVSRQIEQVEAKVRREMEPHRELVELWDAVPGMNEMVAWTLIAEMGDGHGSFSDRCPCSQLGGNVSGNQRKCGAADGHQDAEREPVFAAGLAGGSLGGDAQEE